MASKRKAQTLSKEPLEYFDATIKTTPMVCPLCQRELGVINVDAHHLVPKTFKGKELVNLHKICHRTLHSLLTERELLNYYHTIDRLLELDELQKFIRWVKTKPPEFYVSTKDSNDRKSKRRR